MLQAVCGLSTCSSLLVARHRNQTLALSRVDRTQLGHNINNPQSDAL